MRLILKYFDRWLTKSEDLQLHLKSSDGDELWNPPLTL